MRRREFIAVLGCAPLGARAQSTPVVGLLSSASAARYQEFTAAFHRGLAETGFVEGRNVAVDYRWADGDYKRLPELAADLVKTRPAVIFANGPAAPHAKAATTIIRADEVIE